MNEHVLLTYDHRRLARRIVRRWGGRFTRVDKEKEGRVIYEWLGPKIKEAERERQSRTGEKP